MAHPPVPLSNLFGDGDERLAKVVEEFLRDRLDIERIVVMLLNGQRSEADGWMDWQASTISESMRVIFWGLVRTPADKRDMAAIKKAAADAGKLWARLDQKLEGRHYVAGQHLTMGDIPVGCFVHRWYALDVERPELKNVKAWYERLKARPAYAKHVMAPLT